MRVLMTTDTIGGVWTFTQELTTGLLAEGSSVTLVSLGRTPNTEQQLWANATEQDWNGRFSFHSLQTSLEWMHDNARAYSDAAPLLFELASRCKADLVHCNQFCFGSLPVSIPKLVTAHSDVLSWADGCRSAPLEDSSWLRRYRSLVTDGLEQADSIVAPTQWMLEALSNNFQLPVPQHVVSNGLTLQPSEPRARKLQAITAGRLWDEAKNIEMLSHVRWPMPLMIAGEDFEGVAQHNHAEFVGNLPRQALLSHFAESAIYICSSKYEPFGLAPLEAALCGCAVLAHDIPSLREVWGCGALYFRDPDTLSKTLQSLITNPQTLAKAQARSLARARRYSRTAMTSAYLSVFEALIAPKEDLAHVA